MLIQRIFWSPTSRSSSRWETKTRKKPTEYMRCLGFTIWQINQEAGWYDYKYLMITMNVIMNRMMMLMMLILGKGTLKTLRMRITLISRITFPALPITWETSPWPLTRTTILENQCYQCRDLSVLQLLHDKGHEVGKDGEQVDHIQGSLKKFNVKSFDKIGIWEGCIKFASTNTKM